MSLKKNVASNYFGQGWRAAINLAFVPFYIKYLGIESYALIGIFALLQSWLGLLDMGMKPALGREMARFTGGAHGTQAIRDLLRSIEVIGLAIASTVALCVWLCSSWLASDWLKAGNLPVQVVAGAFSAMGIVAGLRFIEDLYISCLAGLQLQVEQNIITSIMATARALGAVALLAFVAPTIKVFFLWQGLISLATVIVFAGVVHRALPIAPSPPRFSVSALLGIWQFAAGMMAITLLTLLLTQVDKILLSRLLPLESFGYYSLAGVAAGSLTLVAGPITAALYPRFTELVTNGDEVALCAVYHQGAQLVAVLMGSAAMVLMVFPERVLRLWTGNPDLSRRVAPLMAVLTLGTLLNGMMWIPYQVQLAHGWTSLTIKINIVAVGLLVPAILIVVPAYGAIGAARIWVTLNASYLIFAIPLMHRRLLPADKWRWYGQDIAAPLSVAAMAALLCRWAMPHDLGRPGEFSVLLIAATSVLSASALAASEVRGKLVLLVAGRIRSFN